MTKPKCSVKMPLERMVALRLPGLRAFAFLASGLTFAGSANAVTTYAEANALIGGLPPVVDIHSGGAKGVSAQANVFATATGGTAQGDVSTLALLGSVSASGHSEADLGTQVQGGGKAQYSDSFVINAPGLSGTMGMMPVFAGVGGDVLVDFSGITHQAAGVAVANFFVNTFVPGGNFAQQGGYRHIVGVGIDLEEGLKNFTLGVGELPFIFGQPISVTLRLTINTGVDTVGDEVFAKATTNYTMSWIGISGVYNQNGRRITSFTAVSPESGYNFAAVPEPGTYGLMLVGLGVVALAGRRNPFRTN